MRIEKEILLQVIKQTIKSYKDHPENFHGICLEVTRVVGFDYDQMKRFNRWFLSQRPTNRMNKQFYTKKSGSFWWWIGDYPIRIAFLNHLLKKRIR